MVAVIKILLIVMLMVFVDLIIQQITGGEYGIIAVALLLIRVILAFVVIIVHGLTHWGSIPDDFALLTMGIISFLIWLGNSLINIMFDLWELPFKVVGDLLAPLGMGIKLEMPLIGGILIDFRTLTFQVRIGNIDGLDIFGVKFYIKNTIGFSFFGNDASWLNPNYWYMKGFDGNWYSWYKKGMGKFSITLDFKDGADTCFPDLIGIGKCVMDNLPPLRNPLACLDPSSSKYKCFEAKLIIETPKDFKVLNLIGFIQDMLDAVPVPSLGDWVDQVFAEYLPGVSFTNIQMINSLKLEELNYSCLKRKPIRNMVLI